MPTKLVKNILYIEDDEGLARLMQKRMERFGLNVDTASTGEDGIRKFHENKYDVILVDNYLPGISGLDVLKKLEPGEFDTPTIFITSSGDERLAIEALKSGAADYMIKDPAQTYFDLLPLVMSAAFTRVQLSNQNKLHEETLRNYAKDLMRSEDRLNMALEGSGTGVWDWDMRTGESFWSDNLKSSTKLPAGQKPGIKYWMSRVHPEDRDKMRDAMRRHLNKENEFYDVLFREKSTKPEREWNWILARGKAQFDNNGKAFRMIGTSSDFTTYKELEEQFEAAKNKAESANIAKTEFLATMSHEIRTPMNAIVGLADILTRTALNDNQTEIIKTIQSSSETLLSLINDLLDISRIESNQIEFEKLPVNLCQLISEAAKMFEFTAKQKNISLVLKCSTLDGRIFTGDQLRIKQILNNLLSNAIKFTSKGSVTIDADYQLVKHNIYSLKISVSDNGIGIAADKLDTIFQKFTQADQTITRRFGGTGLGLTISRSLAKQMGGDLTVESIPGNGSTFTFTVNLECVNHDAENHQGNFTNQQSQTKPVILLVEDYPANIMVASFMLEDMGYDFEVVNSGAEAIEKIAGNPHKFGIILMDIQMPGMDGFEATRQIRNKEATGEFSAKNIIIGLTAHALTGDRERCIAAGMNEYVTKPINPFELNSKITSLWSKEC